MEEFIDERLLGKSQDNLVLEIGPGTGRIFDILENDLKCRTIAVELAENMVELASLKSPNTIFIIDDVLKVSFKKNQFDAIFMGALIHNFPLEDAKKLLEKTYDWLKEDGKLLLYTTIHEKSEEGYFEKEDYSGKIIRYRKKYMEDELKELVESIHFKIDYKMYNEEPDRNKNWIVYILTK